MDMNSRNQYLKVL